MNNVFPWIFLVIVILVLGSMVSDAKPVFNNVPGDVYIGDAEGEGRILMYLDITEAEEYTCEVKDIKSDPGGDNNDEFDVFQIPSQPESNIRWVLRSLVPTMISSATYEVEIECENESGQKSDKEIVNVIVRDGESLTDCETTLDVDAIATAAGTVLPGTVSCVSTLGHVVDYSFPDDSTYFQVNSVTGALSAKTALAVVNSTTPSISVLAACLDKTDQLMRYCYIHFNMINQNTPPITYTLPYEDTVPENLVPGSSLFTLNVEDPDAGQTHTFPYTCTPAAATGLFEFNSNVFQLKSDQNFDYDNINYIECDVWIKDDYMETGPYSYTLTITDRNNAPSCDKSMYYGTLTEETTPGAETTDPGFSCTDDSGGTATFSLSTKNDSHQYSITSAGVISYSTLYDRETSGTTRVLEVYCDDDGGAANVPLRDTCYVTITNTDVNDNVPAFTTDYEVFVITDSTKVGTTLTTFAVTDPDEGDAGQTSCSITTTSPYIEYVDVTRGCAVRLIKLPALSEDTHISKSDEKFHSNYNAHEALPPRYDVIATDGGTPALSSTVGIELVYQKTTTTTVIPVTVYEFWEEPGSIVALIAALAGGLLLAGLAGFLCWRFCLGKGQPLRRWLTECKCLRPKRHRPRPPSPRPDSPYYDKPPPPRKKGKLMISYWKKVTPKPITRTLPVKPFVMQPPSNMLPLQTQGPARMAFINAPNRSLPLSIGR